MFMDIAEERMNQQQYIEVLEQKMLSEFHKNFPGGDGVFQQDGAPCHTAKSVMNFCKKNNVTMTPWPWNIPNMNPIENLWITVKRRIAQRKSTTIISLIEALIDVWARDPEITKMCSKLTESMPKRIELLKKANGVSTKY